MSIIPVNVIYKLILHVVKLCIIGPHLFISQKKFIHCGRMLGDPCDKNDECSSNYCERFCTDNPYEPSDTDTMNLNMEYLNLDNNLTNIVNSGSKGNADNIIQILMSVGVDTLLPNCYIENSYYNGLSSKELFISSKSGRYGLISTSLSTSSTGYLQRELVKSMEDLVSDTEGVIRDYTGNEIFYYPFATNTPEIDDTFLEYAFTNACKKKLNKF